jgi:hypothetical protein
VPSWFTEQGDGSWYCGKYKSVLAQGMLTTYRGMPALGGLSGFIALGLPMGSEYNPKANTGVQHFERGILVWDPGHVLDAAPGEVGDFYLANIDDPLFNLTLAHDRARIADLEAQLAAAQTDATPEHAVQFTLGGTLQHSGGIRYHSGRPQII